VVYDRVPPALLSYEAGQSKVPAVDQQLLDRDEFLAEIKDRMQHAQDLMKHHYDPHHESWNLKEIGYGCAFITAWLLH
jgi:hypothetical protein